jgi:hypothetical protein
MPNWRVEHNKLECLTLTNIFPVVTNICTSSLLFKDKIKLEKFVRLKRSSLFCRRINKQVRILTLGRIVGWGDETKNDL